MKLNRRDLVEGRPLFTRFTKDGATWIIGDMKSGTYFL